MTVRISKKQRIALKQMDDLEKQRKRDIVLGVASIVVMIILIMTYNYLTYEAGIISMEDTVTRGILYAIAVVIAGFCGIQLMHASQKKAKIEGYRQANRISNETLAAWRKGDVD